MKKTIVFIVGMLVSALLLSGCETGNRTNDNPDNSKKSEITASENKTDESKEIKNEDKTNDKNNEVNKESKETVSPEVTSSYNVEIDNYNRKTTYTEMPKRIVSLSYSETEILVALGLEDKIVGIAEADNTIDECSDKYRATIEGLNIISSTEEGGVPTLETLLKAEPDFVYATSFSLNSEYGVGELSDFEKYGIKVYVSTPTYKADCTIEDVYGDIRNIAKIFSVEEKGEEIISGMQQKIDNVKERISSVSSPLKVFAYIAGNESRAATVGGGSLADDLMSRAGVVNVFGTEPEGMFGVSMEAIVQANPDIIILFENIGGNGMGGANEKKELLKSIDVLNDVTAIKEDRFIEIPDFIMEFATVQNGDAVEMLARGVYPELFE